MFDWRARTNLLKNPGYSQISFFWKVSTGKGDKKFREKKKLGSPKNMNGNAFLPLYFAKDLLGKFPNHYLPLVQ